MCFVDVIDVVLVKVLCDIFFMKLVYVIWFVFGDVIGMW